MDLSLFEHLTVSSIVDILLVTSLFFGFFYLLRGTRVVTLVRGVLLVAFAGILASNFLRLTAFSWLIRNSIPALLVAIPVIFQPELRRALERLGRPQDLIMARRGGSYIQFVGTLSRTASALSDARVGALIVIERHTGLQEYVENGVHLDADLSTDLLMTVFMKGTPLHDGAVILREARILAAGCTLPLSENLELDRDLGTRHRAAVGITETTDAIAIAVSEETGSISVACNGRLTRHLDEGGLSRFLAGLYNPRLAVNSRSRNVLLANGKSKS